MKILELFERESGRPRPDALQMPYVVAEAGVNHGADLDVAKRLIDLACEGGADAIKFQTYRAETLASRDSPSYWDLSKEPTRSQFELFQSYDKFWKSEFEALKLHCDRAGIEFLSTPFDLESVGFLDDLMPVFKISSSDITNRPFIEAIAGRGKPIILSTGASELHEIREAVQWVAPFGVPLALLHCVLNYPTPEASANLGMIVGLAREFPDHIIGYSDHALPADMRMLESATLLGARILEKHFSHDKTLPGNDHYHAMDVRDLERFRENMKRLLVTVGPFEVRSLPEEATARAHARRSLVARRKIRRGQTISEDDLTWKRPGSGISPRDFHEVLGRTASCDIDDDAILQWEMLGDA